MSQRELERQIKQTIKSHYGWNLASFRPELSDSEEIAPLVSSLARIFSGSADLGESGMPYARAGTSDKEIGSHLKASRLSRGMSVEKVAAKMRVHPDFLSAFEAGEVITFPHHIVDELRAVKATRKQRDQISECIMSYSSRKTISRRHGMARIDQGPLDQMIINVIEQYYGQNLWIFRPQFGYSNSIAPFVESLRSRAVEYRNTSKKRRASGRLAPPYTDDERLEVINGAVEPKIRKAFRAYAGSRQ